MNKKEEEEEDPPRPCTATHDRCPLSLLTSTNLSRMESLEDIQISFVVSTLMVHIPQVERELRPKIKQHFDTLDADVFAAGTDTTSTTLEWVMTELLKHPQVMKKLQAQVRGIAQTNHRITEDYLDQMPYLKAVIKETLRLHPPIPILVPRELNKDVQVMGYDIAAETQVVTNAWTIGWDPLSWDEPEEFKPERFLNNSADFRGHNFELIPFGAGRRACPGIQFAAVVNELAVANLVHEFDFALSDGVMFNVSEAPGFSVRKMFPLLVVATHHTC